MLNKISPHRFFVSLCRAETSSSSFLRLSKFRKYYGKIISLPTYCVGKDIFLFTEIHNIKFSFIPNFINPSFLLNMGFPFVQSSFFYNFFMFLVLFSVVENLFLLTILITRQNVKLN